MASVTSSSGVYPIVASGASDSNYEITHVDGTLTIGKTSLVLSADDKTKTYGDTNPALSYSVSGFVNGDEVGDLDTAPVLLTNASTSSEVGDYGISISGALNSNYLISYVEGALSVTPAPLQVTAQDASRNYGSANPSFDVVYSGFVLGEGAVDLDLSAAASTVASVTSSSGVYPIVAGGASDSNYEVIHIDGTLTIDKALLTISAIDKVKTYGDANPNFTYEASGFVNGDDLGDLDTNPVLSTTVTENSFPGDYTINVSGALDNNYTFDYEKSVLRVTPTVLIVVVENQFWTEGSVNLSFTALYSGFKLDDESDGLEVGVLYSTEANEASLAGTYDIVASGASDPRYDVEYVNGVLTVVALDELVIVADSFERFYGSNNPTLTFQVFGLLNGDSIDVLETLPTLTVLADNESPSGDYVISISGASSSNYSINHVGGTLSIDAAPLLVSVQDANRSYGGSNPAFDVVYTGFVFGEDETDLDSSATAVTAATDTSPSGVYPIVVSGTSDLNYEATHVDGELTVGKASLVLSAVDIERSYGDANPDLTYSGFGFVNGDDVGDLDTAPILSTVAVAASFPGDYAINISGALDDNYVFTYEESVLQITPAVLIVMVEDETRTQGEHNPDFTVLYSGFKLDDGFEGLDIGVSVSTEADEVSTVGEYGIVASGVFDLRYEIEYRDGILTIVPLDGVTIVADSFERLYGSGNPALTFKVFGLLNGDTIDILETSPVLTVSADEKSLPGEYVIDVSGATASEYSISYTRGVLHVLPKPLEVVADDLVKTVYQPNPKLTARVIGFELGQDVGDLDTPVLLSTNADEHSPPGLYEIKASGASDARYIIDFKSGVLSIVTNSIVKDFEIGVDGIGIIGFVGTPLTPYRLELSSDMENWIIFKSTTTDGDGNGVFDGFSINLLGDGLFARVIEDS